MKLLVFGRTGQLARELAACVPAGVSARFLGRDEADLADPAACAAIVTASDVDAVIIAAAYTAVDRAESEEALAMGVNGAAPAAIAAAAAARGAALLHVSTDYVFDGSGTASWTPASPTRPLGAYGRSKLAGEQGVRAAGGNWAIVRTSWVFSPHGSNFPKTMLRLGAERDTLNVVADQIGGPTPAAAIAAALITMARAMAGGQQGGLYHFAGAPDVSWADFARAVMAEARLPCRINDIPTSGYPTPAVRPANSRLDCNAIERDFGIARPDWRTFLPSLMETANT